MDAQEMLALLAGNPAGPVYPKWVQRAPHIGAVLCQNEAEERELMSDWNKACEAKARAEAEAAERTAAEAKAMAELKLAPAPTPALSPAPAEVGGDMNAGKSGKK